MRRSIQLLYALIAWVGFLAVVLWAVTFLADVDLVTTIDAPRVGSLAGSAIIDLLLLGVFAAHHSVMARPAAKRVLTRVVPPAAERSTYVLVADLLLALVLWAWRPMPHQLWHLTQPWAAAVWAIFGCGWVIAIASTFMIDHFDLVGIRQAASPAYAPPPFQVRWLYRIVRHPLMLGLLIAFWATPSMTVGHLLFALAATGYIIVGVWLEERDLRSTLGEPYLEYAARTPAILPTPRRRTRAGLRTTVCDSHEAYSGGRTIPKL